MNEELGRRFPLSEAECDNPFIIASILDPGRKQLRTVSDNMHQAAYSNVWSLLRNITLPQVVEDESKPEKRHYTDLEFILGNTYSGATEMPSADTEFNAYLTDSSVSRGDSLLWWKTNISACCRTRATLPWHTTDVCHVRVVVQSKWKSDNENKKPSSS